MQVLTADGSLDCSALQDQSVFGSGRLGHVFAVVGAQSSGKSTLCNAGFGANFPTLDVTSGAPRGRTTEGVWVAADPDTGCVVLDCEGADSRERGSGKVAFESKVVALALEVADTVVLNVWAHDLGRVQGAGYHLVEVMLASWVRVTRTRPMHLVFVLRDVDEEQTPFDLAKNLLEQDVLTMWARLAKSNYSLEQSNIFLQVVPLPHYRFCSALWHDEVKTLPQKLTDQYPAQAHSTPLDLLGDRIASVWAGGGEGQRAATVSDLPSHSVLARAHRQKRVVAGVIQITSVEVDELFRDVEGAAWAGAPAVEDFGERAEKLVQGAQARYSKAMGGSKSEPSPALMEKLGELLLPLREVHLGGHEDSVARYFDDKFMLMLAGSRNFEKDAKVLTKECTLMLTKHIANAQIPSLMAHEPSEDPVLKDFEVRIDEQIEERAALGAAMAPIPGEDLMIDADLEPPPWWKPLVMQVANIGLNLGINWLLVKVLGGGRDDPARRQRRLERKQPQSPTF